MAALRFWFADRSQHDGGGDTFGKAKNTKRSRTRDHESEFSQGQRNAEPGRREADAPRRGIRGWLS